MATKISAKDRQATINHLIARDQELYEELQGLKSDAMRYAGEGNPMLEGVCRRLQAICDKLKEHLDRNEAALSWAV